MKSSKIYQHVGDDPADVSDSPVNHEFLLTDTMLDFILHMSIHFGAFLYQALTWTVTLNFMERYLFSRRLDFYLQG